VAASVAANIAAAHPSVGARIVAAWPAIAMLLVVEMLSRARPPAASSESGPLVAAADASRARLSEVSTKRVGVESVGDGPERPDRKRARTAGPRRRKTVEAVAQFTAERPGATPAEIAAAVGVSERHVRRLLTDPSPSPGATVVSAPPSWSADGEGSATVPREAMMR
jgi:hypothetical protein